MIFVHQPPKFCVNMYFLTLFNLFECRFPFWTMMSMAGEGFLVELRRERNGCLDPTGLDVE